MSHTRSVFIRADGSKAIGMGHLNRAWLIAGMLKSRFGLDSKILMRKDRLGEGFAKRRGLNFETFDAPTVKEEIEFLQVKAFEETPALMILDVLENDTDRFYTDCLRKFCAPLIAITDDSFRRVIDADVVINGNPAQIGLDYSTEDGKYLLGPQYFVMDEAYAGVHQTPPQLEVSKILVTLGASDHNDLIFKLLEALKAIEGEFALLLIVSSASGYVDRLKSFVSNYPRKCDFHIDAPTLVPFWKQADVAITAGGNTLFERIAARLPGATLCQLKRQNEIADSFERLGVNKNLGFGPELSHRQIQDGIEVFLKDRNLRINHFERSPLYVDGKGLERLGRELELLLKETRA